MEKEQYQKPEMEIVLCEGEDVIITSICNHELPIDT